MTVTPQVRKLETSANYGKFDIEPLDPGFGTTLGNTLRRVLLSSLWGAAVTSIQIDGVAHEFTAIPHVKEDVTEVILNIKKLNLKSFTEDPVTLLLDVKGPAEVRASHIQASSDVEIVNPDLYICLKANEIQTVGQLLQKREEELLALRNFGRKSLDEIKEKLVEKGFIKPEEMGTVLRG